MLQLLLSRSYFSQSFRTAIRSLLFICILRELCLLLQKIEWKTMVRTMILRRSSANKSKHNASCEGVDDPVIFEGPGVYSCTNCRTHFTHEQELMSKAFYGRYGRAYLFNSAVNLALGPKEERALMTGMHVVCDIYCVHCDTVVGWKYEQAFHPTQKYKVGKFIFEKTKIMREN